MDKTVFNKVRSIVYEKAGIRIAESKMSLVSARLGKRLRALKISDDKAYIKFLLADESGKEMVELLNVISTNVTHFFREPHHFDLVHKLVADWAKQGQSRFRFWSAASSSGEEPYTLAMTLLDTFKSQSKKPDMRILATDISTKVLADAKAGVYEAGKLEDVESSYVSRFFDKSQSNGQDAFTIKPAIRQMVSFTRMNLSTPPFPMKGPLDIVFCRNVMIYFDNKVRQRLLDEVARLLKPGGYLMVGHSESLNGVNVALKRVGSSIYQKAA